MRQLTDSELDDLRKFAESPFSTRPLNPDLVAFLVEEVAWLRREVERLRRSIG